MYETKVNLVMALPGRTMMSEQECLRKVRKPLMKGKNANEQVIDKKGNPVWHTVIEPDPAKTDRFQIEVDPLDGRPVTITVSTRKSYPATRRLNICQEAYDNYISASVPEAFHAPKGFKPPKITTKSGKEVFKYTGVSPKKQAWLEMSQTERLKWHLRGICAALGGMMETYTVLDD